MKTGVIISPTIEQRMIEARQTSVAPFEATGIAGRKGMPPKLTVIPGLFCWAVGKDPPDCRNQMRSAIMGTRSFSP